jgi:hypothetical protein
LKRPNASEILKPPANCIATIARFRTPEMLRVENPARIEVISSAEKTVPVIRLGFLFIAGPLRQ